MVPALALMTIGVVVLVCALKASAKPLPDDNDPYFDNPDNPTWRN